MVATRGTEHEEVIVVERFAEPKPGSRMMSLTPSWMQPVDTSGEISRDFGHEIVVMGLLLHGLRSPSHVHENVGDVQRSDSLEHGFVEFSSGDVVDDLYHRGRSTLRRAISARNVSTDSMASG